MNFGYFDDTNREYVVTRPDTPTSWSNYLGDTNFGAVITNNAGGYGFHKSGAQGRYLRLRFNSIPMDQPGRYFYLRDQDSGDFWSASWQPVGKPLDQYKSVCHHGTAYSTFESDYAGIHSEATYFIPLGQTFEYWKLKVTNTSDRPRNISAFTYCEFANFSHTTQDLVNLQYTLFLVRGEKRDGLIRISINEHLLNDERPNVDHGQYLWMALVGAPMAAFDTQRETFLGPYRSYDRPIAVEKGQCANSEAYGDNSCGSVQANLTLQPGESREILVMLGLGLAETVGQKTVAEYGSLARADAELAALKKLWHSRLDSLTVNTPDDGFNHTLNVWGLYNNLITFAWSRAASLVYNGERDGLGFRDSVQDVLGVCAAIPEDARARLALMLTGQDSNGGAMPLVQPFNHHPGKMPLTDPKHYRSDDCQWFFNAIPMYVAETGDVAFYNEVLPYADKGEATVFGHLRRALEFNLERMGKHGLPCGLSADWNDCLALGYNGESLFVAFQLRYGLNTYAEIAEMLGKPAEAAWAKAHIPALDAAIQKHCWDGEWFIWAIGEDGTVYGTKDYEEGQVYMNTQVWSVISGAATPEQARKCLESMNKKLATPYGIALCNPPFEKSKIDVMRAVLFLNGIKENGGIFNHTQGWGVMAECLMGNGDRAFEYYRAFMPAAYNDIAEVRGCEPYVQGQTTYSTTAPRAGTCRTSWLSGAAAWAYYSAFYSILGLQPQLNGFRIDPCIPHDWPGFTATRRFRGKVLNIEVTNPSQVCRGVKSLTVNGKVIEGNTIPLGMMADVNDVKVVLGS
jgi:cellobiose phosphorylase